MHRKIILGIGIFFGLLLLQELAPAERPRENRVEPPEWNPADTEGIFFDDVFTEGLIGPRPENFGQGSSGRRPAPGGNPPPTEGGNGNSGGVYAWSEIISPTTLEDYVKALKLQVDENITSPGRYAGQGYKEGRRQFSLLALTFAIIAEYDGEVRFQESAPTARERFARTASNSKVGTIQVFNEARLRKEELQSLISGAGIEAQPNVEAAADWSNVCDRGPIMQWMEMIHEERLLQWTGNSNEFSSHKEEIIRDAEMLAAMATVLTKKGMEDALDDDYQAFCETMKAGAQEIIAAVGLNNPQQAQHGAGEITKSCSDCHDLYRG